MLEPRKILIVQPSWVGDAVMATPTLRAVRLLYPNAHISYLMKRYVKPVYTGMPWVDQLITYRTGKTTKKSGKSLFDLAARLGSARFDLAVLLPNSFQSALICKMARIDRVVGYERDGRSFLLTDRLLAPKDKGKFIPSPIIKYYMGLARYLGAAERDLKMELFVTETERKEAEEVLRRAGLDAQDLSRATNSATDASAARRDGPWILLNPGAQFGAAKCWLPESFAALSDRFVNELGAKVLISSAPRERQIVDAIVRHTKRPTYDLQKAGLSLGTLKEIVRRCDLMVTNDTGPRHIAAALDVPVVTVFGPTHPAWTEIYYSKETQVAIKVFCGPCQKKICPLDHRCMTGISPAMVFDASVGLLKPGGIFVDLKRQQS